MAEERINDSSHAEESAPKRAHGPHGKGTDEEQHRDDAPVEPTHAEGQVRGTDAWGGEAAGGSTVDKREDKSRG